MGLNRPLPVTCWPASKRSSTRALLVLTQIFAGDHILLLKRPAALIRQKIR